MITEETKAREQALYDIVLQEVAQAGGPTDRCMAIYRQRFNATSGMRRSRYWEAVRHGHSRFHNNKRRNMP